MKYRSTLALVFVLSGFLTAADDKKADPKNDPYVEFFTVPDKVTLDSKQKEKLARLRKEYEPELARLDKEMKTPGAGVFSHPDRDKLARMLTRKRMLIFTEDQRTALGMKYSPPFITEEKSLKDEKIWDLSQLEKVFVIQSRDYDPEENVISFMVITKRQLTNEEKQLDGDNWRGSAVKVIFYDKNDESLFIFHPPHPQGPRAPNIVGGGVTRTPTKLTDTEAEQGLLRFRVKIDLDHRLAHPTKVKDTVGMVKSVKIVCPEPKR